jgi:hypothetical protein
MGCLYAIKGVYTDIDGCNMKILLLDELLSSDDLISEIIL